MLPICPGVSRAADIVCSGTPGELFSRTAYACQEYWKLPDKAAAAFRGRYCTVNDIARGDEGYITI